MSDPNEPTELFDSASGPTGASITDWTDLGREMLSLIHI